MYVCIYKRRHDMSTSIYTYADIHAYMYLYMRAHTDMYRERERELYIVQ